MLASQWRELKFSAFSRQIRTSRPCPLTGCLTQQPYAEQRSNNITQTDDVRMYVWITALINQSLYQFESTPPPQRSQVLSMACFISTMKAVCWCCETPELSAHCNAQRRRQTAHKGGVFVAPHESALGRKRTFTAPALLSMDSAPAGASASCS